MTTRDSMADAEGHDTATSSKGRGPYMGANFAFMTLEEEARNGGWTRITRPVGPGVLDDAPMVGMRGESDFDNDKTYTNTIDGAPYWDDAGTGNQSPPTTGGGRNR